MSRKSYEERIESIRKQRDERIASNPLDWLNLAGLFWLGEGGNSFGSDKDNLIVMPEFPHPQCGTFHLDNGLVTLHPAKDVNITLNGKLPESRPLRTDLDQTPDLMEIGPLTMKVIVRGEAILLRMWNREALAQKNFKGFKYYPPKPEYCITAKYIPYNPPRPIKSMDMIGTETESVFLGQAQFSWDGVSCTLEAEKNSEKILFHFDDQTKADTTYGSGRKFSVPVPQSNEVVLDFNLAENWPCAYTPYATCPITPMENRLPIRIEAGEKKYFE